MLDTIVVNISTVLTIFDIPSTFSPVDIPFVERRYQIPNSMKIRAPGPEERAYYHLAFTQFNISISLKITNIQEKNIFNFFFALATGCWGSFCTSRLIPARDSWLPLTQHYFNNSGNRPGEQTQLTLRFFQWYPYITWPKGLVNKIFLWNTMRKEIATLSVSFFPFLSFF